MEIDFKPIDEKVFEEEFKDFLPSKIFDAHMHICDKKNMPPSYINKDDGFMGKFDNHFPLEGYIDYTAKMFPGIEFYTNSFGFPSLDADRDGSANYSGTIADNKKHYAMAMVSPKDKIEDIKKRVLDNSLIGYKPYLNFVDWKSTAEIEIFDMLPDDQMQFANEKKLVVTLHIPRPGRLADPVNQKQMVEICKRYPNAKIIFAHIGRAYYMQNVVGQLEGLKDLPNAYIETSMVNHDGVIEYVFNNFPRERIIFGTDAPIAMVRGKSVEVNNNYAYLVGENLNIGTAIFDRANAVKFSTFYYEQIRGIKLAVQRAGLSKKEIEDFFFNTSYNLFTQAVKDVYGN